MTTGLDSFYSNLALHLATMLLFPMENLPPLNTLHGDELPRASVFPHQEDTTLKTPMNEFQANPGLAGC